MKAFTERNPVVTAAVGLVATLVLIALALNFQSLPLVGQGRAYQADFTDASGIQVGEDVRIAGIKVGTVSSIDLVGSHVVVGFHVKGTTFGRDTTAGIEVQTLLGQHYLSLTPAGPGSLPAGSEIPLQRTSTPLNIVPAFQRLTRTSEAIDTQQVARAFDTLSVALEGTAPQVRSTLQGLSALSRTIADRDDGIQQLFARARTVSSVIASRDQQIAQLLSDTNSVLGMLNQRRATISAIIDGTDKLAIQLTGLIQDNQQQLRPTLDKLHDVLDVLHRDNSQLDFILGQMDVFDKEFADVGGSGQWFDATLKFPRGMALCENGPKSPFTAALDPVLSRMNQAVNGSGTPCLPLGPAADSVDPNQKGGG